MPGIRAALQLLDALDVGHVESVATHEHNARAVPKHTDAAADGRVDEEVELVLAPPTALAIDLVLNEIVVLFTLSSCWLRRQGSARTTRTMDGVAGSGVKLKAQSRELIQRVNPESQSRESSPTNASQWARIWHARHQRFVGASPAVFFAVHGANPMDVSGSASLNPCLQTHFVTTIHLALHRAATY